MIINDSFKVRRFILAAAFFVGLGFVNYAFASVGSYLIDLNSKTSTYFINMDRAFSINDSGQIAGVTSAGFSGRNVGYRAFITGSNGEGMKALDTLGGDRSQANGINEAGQVAGWSTTEGEDYEHAFITGPNGEGMRALGTFASAATYAAAINNAGQVVGSRTTNGVIHAFITGPRGQGMRHLDTLDAFSGAEDINDKGQVVGYFSRMIGESYHAFITGPDGTGMRDLGTLGGALSFASAINNTGQVVGHADLPGNAEHAFVTGPDGEGMRDLGTLASGRAFSWAYGINDVGQVVGASETDGTPHYDFPACPTCHAFIAGLNGEGMIDLNSLVDLPPGVVLLQATDINNAGQVIGLASFSPISPISEPKIPALLLAGIPLIGFMVRRQKSERLI